MIRDELIKKAETLGLDVTGLKVSEIKELLNTVEENKVELKTDLESGDHEVLDVEVLEKETSKIPLTVTQMKNMTHQQVRSYYL